MSVFDHHSREQLRRTYAEAWAKHLANSPLTPLEALITDVIGAHPEYQSILADADTAIAFEQNAAGSAENPFLHMGLHLAIREQVATNRPAGIAEIHQQLSARLGAHEAEHAMLEPLAETLWEAQRQGRMPDEQVYLERLRKL